jgi:Kef-type K+ transport system membrane component KefB
MELHFVLIAIGSLFLVGLATDELGRRTRLPRVTLLMLFGVLIGPAGADILPPEAKSGYEFLASTALTMVAFLLGGVLSVPKLQRHGKEILITSLLVVSVSAFIVGGGLLALGVSIPAALVLAAIATATAPAATRDVATQVRSTKGFKEKLLGIVAIDDAWGLIIFSLLLIAAKTITGGEFVDVLRHGAAYLTGRLRPGEPMQSEALGLVFLCAGLAIWLEVSFLLAGMIAGATVANLAKHHRRPFHEIEHIEWPFMLLFFVLAGASFETNHLADLGAIGAAYIILRALSRMVGGWLGGKLAGLPAIESRWIGFALMPQAGVALGMALVAGHHFPDQRDVILGVTIASTIVFEIFGPIMTQIALIRVGEHAEVETQ